MPNSERIRGLLELDDSEKNTKVYTFVFFQIFDQIRSAPDRLETLTPDRNWSKTLKKLFSFLLRPLGQEFACVHFFLNFQDTV